MKKVCTWLLVFAMVIGIMPADVAGAATSYVELQEKSATLTIRKGDKTLFGKTKIKVQARKGAKIVKTTYKSKKKSVATVSKKGKVVAKKEGKTSIIVKVVYKVLGKRKIKKRCSFRFYVNVVEKTDSSKEVNELETETQCTENPEEDDLFRPTVEPAESDAYPPAKNPTTKPTEADESRPTEASTMKPTWEDDEYNKTPEPVEDEEDWGVEEPAVDDTFQPTLEPTVEPAPEPTYKATEEPVKTYIPLETDRPDSAPDTDNNIDAGDDIIIKDEGSGTINAEEYTIVKSGTYKINTKVDDNMVLDVDGNYVLNKTNIRIHHNNGTTAQNFVISHVGDGWYTICKDGSDKYIDVDGGVKKEGTNVQIFDYNGSDAQLWRFYDVGDGYYQIKNKLGYYLDVAAGESTEDTNVQVWGENQTDAQKWKLIDVVYPTSVSAIGGSIEMTTLYDTKNIALTFEPRNTTEKRVEWSSSDENIVTVKNGVVTAVENGSATVAAKTTNGKTVRVSVNVNDGHIDVEEGDYCIGTKAKSNYTLDVEGNRTEDGTNIQVHKNNGSVAQKFHIEEEKDGWYVISNTYPKKCLDVEGGKRKSATNVQLYGYNGTEAQKWRFYSAGDGYYYIRNKLGFYLDVATGMKESESVWVYDYNGSDAQKWKLSKTTIDFVNIVTGLYTIGAKKDGKYLLDVEGNKTEDGSNVAIYEKNGTMAQKWDIQNAGGSWYTITNPFSGKPLDVEGGSAKSGANVQIYTGNSSDAQKWRFYREGDYFLIKNKAGEKYLDVAAGQIANDVNVQVYEKNQTDAQRWKLERTSIVELTGISLSATSIMLRPGETYNVSVGYTPSNATAANTEVNWGTSNAGVATVVNGVISAVGSGTATITARSYNGKTATVNVSVSSGTLIVENAISWAVSIANDNAHGYSQSSRWGPDYDCSSFVISAFKNAGVNVGAHSNRGYPQTGDQTGTEVSVSGYYYHPWDGILRYVG